jgi:hypothetical protein
MKNGANHPTSTASSRALMHPLLFRRTRRKVALAVSATAALVLSLSPAAHARSAERTPGVSEHAIEAGNSREEQAGSDAARRVMQWISESGDNDSLPYAVIDKHAAALFLFDSAGHLVGKAPVLIGLAMGDDSSPGVGSKDLAQIGPAERTTPAGRFFASYGPAAGGETVLWVDYPDSVAMHAVITSNKKERRLQRLRSRTAADNRITFGCINVPTDFYQTRIEPMFQDRGGIVYILPDTKPLVEFFPGLRTRTLLATESD